MLIYRKSKLSCINNLTVWCTIMKGEPAVAWESCTCQPPPDSLGGFCPTRFGRRHAASVPAQSDPSDAGRVVFAVHPPEQDTTPPSPSPDTQRNGWSRLKIKAEDLRWQDIHMMFRNDTETIIKKKGQSKICKGRNLLCWMGNLPLTLPPMWMCVWH